MNIERLDAWYRMTPGEIMSLWMIHRDFNGWNKKDKSADEL
jgi:hypothetical protein